MLGLLLLSAAVSAWTGLDGEEGDYIENTEESQQIEEHSDDTGNGHIDSDHNDDNNDGNDDNDDGNDDSDDDGDNEESETDADVSAGDSETVEAEFVDPSQYVG